MCHGYGHPHIRQAVAAQLETLPHVMFAGIVHEPALSLARRLAALLPGDGKRRLDRVFFSESGSMAVEVALKMAVQYWRNRGQERRRFLAFRGGYHGDTLGALSVTDPGCGYHDALAGYRVPQFFAALPAPSLPPIAALHRRYASVARRFPTLLSGASHTDINDPQLVRQLVRRSLSWGGPLEAGEIVVTNCRRCW